MSFFRGWRGLGRGLALLLALAATVGADPSQEFREILKQYDQFRERSKPGVEALGKDLSSIPLSVRRSGLQGSLERRIDALDPASLGDQDWIDWHLLKSMLARSGSRERSRLSALDEPLLPIREVTRMLQKRDPGELESLYGALRFVPEWIRLSQNRSLGEVQKSQVKSALARAKGLRQILEKEGGAACRVLGYLGASPQRIQDEALGSLSEYERYLNNVLLPRAISDQLGIGREQFVYRLEKIYLVDHSLAEILDSARKVMRETEEEMERLVRVIDPHATGWRSVSELLKEDHPDRDGIVPYLRQVTFDARDFVQRAGFITLPDYSMEMEVVGKDLQGNYPFGYYRRPRSGSRVGAFVVAKVGEKLSPENQERLRGFNRPWMQVVAVHEGYPGHHLQLAIARKKQTPLRSRYYTPFFVEGWGLYSEELMYRHGFLKGPRVRFSQLRMRLWRCARVLIDIGIHAGTMTQEEGVRFLVERAGLSEVNAKKEVSRYLRSPNQPMSYLVGYLDILRIRQVLEDRARKAGQTFDERAFHDALLSYGSVPLRLLREVLLERRVERR